MKHWNTGTQSQFNPIHFLIRSLKSRKTAQTRKGFTIQPVNLTPLKMSKIQCSILIRLPKENAPYYKAQIEIFTERFNPKEILEIQFGKQDIRGSESITIFDNRHCVPRQMHFSNKWEMLGFIKGFNEAKENIHFSNFIK